MGGFSRRAAADPAASRRFLRNLPEDRLQLKVSWRVPNSSRAVNDCGRGDLDDLFRWVRLASSMRLVLSSVRMSRDVYPTDLFGDRSVQSRSSTET
jgi:hypothetical protein